MFVVGFLVEIVFLRIYESSFVHVLFIWTSNFSYNFGIINHKRFIISVSQYWILYLFNY